MNWPGGQRDSTVDNRPSWMTAAPPAPVSPAKTIKRPNPSRFQTPAPALPQPKPAALDDALDRCAVRRLQQLAERPPLPSSEGDERATLAGRPSTTVFALAAARPAAAGQPLRPGAAPAAAGRDRLPHAALQALARVRRHALPHDGPRPPVQVRARRARTTAARGRLRAAARGEEAAAAAKVVVAAARRAEYPLLMMYVTR